MMIAMTPSLSAWVRPLPIPGEGDAPGIDIAQRRKSVVNGGVRSCQDDGLAPRPAPMMATFIGYSRGGSCAEFLHERGNRLRAAGPEGKFVTRSRPEAADQMPNASMTA
jgi:hypothetical protein